MKLVDSTIEFAMKAHNGQYRKNIKIPYFSHCMEVMKRVSLYTDDEEILSIAICHDLLEDTLITYEQLQKHFGDRIARGVKECTRITGDNASKLEKYVFLESFHSKSLDSILVKISDRLCNVNDYTTQKGPYYSKYALQAFPLYQAYMLCDKTTVPHNQEAVHKDLNTLQSLISDNYPLFNIFDPMIQDKVKKIVI